MALISIVGTSGVGKSFLAAQLASLNCAPVFLEGEEGVIPQDVFTTVFAGDPVGRFQYFIDRYNSNLSKAKMISDMGLDVYADGAMMSIEAHVTYEEKKYHDTLNELVNNVPDNNSDVVVLLTANKERLAKSLKSRGRITEQEEEAFTRSIAIQESFIDVSKKYPNVIRIDRTNLDFSNEKDLRMVDKTIKDFLIK